MIRLVLVAIFLFFFAIYSIPALLITWITGFISKDKRDKMTKRIVSNTFKIILFLSGTKVNVEGIENIPKDTAVLYVANHNSFFDIVISYAYIPYLYGFVSKKEVDKVPGLNIWMRFVGCLFLDRDNIKEALKTILKGIDIIKNGFSLFIFPEGTRSKDGKMAEFKEGSMKLAIKSNAPVIPVAMTNTRDIFERQMPRIKSTKVNLIIGKPIYINELSADDKKTLGNYTKNQISKLIEEHKNI